ncbi:hypothetical protein CLAIMM_06673 isoform 1 [Cladophialophora immunda]|nr:hypothetical protein CLAIMM_06673 isoform 1 [Cladophialophora immunda]
MHKALRRQPWTCPRCLRKQQRFNSTAAGIAVANDNTFDGAYLHASSHSSSKNGSENALLREVFNRKTLSKTSSTESSGLIGNTFLTLPQGFQKFAEASVIQCKRLVERTLAASTAEQYRVIPRDLDRLSDLLCRVIDLSDFIRSIHPSDDVAASASASYSLMFQYMNELNTTTGLNQQLKKAWDMPEVQSQWSEEEKMVAVLLMRDFAKSGIHLPDKQRRQFVSLSNEIVQLGTDFINQMDHAREYVSFTVRQLDGIDPTLSARFYFALGHVMQGLSSLFESLYGVRFVPKETKQGEVWHPDVRRLDVYTDKEEHIATMYCDLFSRPGKQSHPAHFTLLCSREISEEEVRECAERNEPLNNGMPTLLSTNPTSGVASHHQIPIIALVCGFPQSSVPGEPALLSQYSLVSLFHEMGHAIHSVLGRTSMQGISGTRVATDFSELPSVLMENFATDPAVLKLFARHWKTDAPMPDEMLKVLAEEGSKEASRQGAWNNESQILMSILDQVYHGDGPVQALRSGRYDSTAVYYDVWNKHGSVPEPWGTSWQGFFGHLHGYGASYYSYLFDTAIARRVWTNVFRGGEDNGAIDRASGERFKEEVLKWGGGRDPWLCLEGLLGEGKGVLAEGGEEAMLEVGRWGVGVGAGTLD